MTAKDITKGSTLLATLKDERNFPCGSSDDLVKELHQMIDKALNHNSVDVHIPYQTCPVCKGEGEVFISQVKDTASLSIGWQTCTVCTGAKIIPMYVVGCDPISIGSKGE